MRKKINILAVLGIFLLLALGYFIPPIVMAMEDSQLQLESKSFVIEEIELNFQNVNILEELAVFPEMLQNNIIVEVGKETSEEEFDSVKDNAQQAVQEDISSKKDHMIKSGLTDFLAVLNVKNELEKISAKNYVMMSSYYDEKVYSVWECIGIDAKGQKYHFWLDDLTGMVMAFEIPYDTIGVSDEDFYEVMENLKEYYGFSVYGLMKHQDNLYKNKYWENQIVLLNETEEKEPLDLDIFKIGETLYFNIYPGTISIYSLEDVKWTESSL